MPKPEAKLRDFVVCDWRDAWSDATGEFSEQQTMEIKSYRFKTYGVLARNDLGKAVEDPVVVIATEIGAEGLYRGVTIIPAEMVVSLQRLKAGPRTSRKTKKSSQEHSNDTSDKLSHEQA